MNDDALSRHARLVAALRRPEAWPTRTSAVRLVETHISSVLLGDDDVYKLKRPVSLGFVDFTTLDSRRQACEDEVRLNRRTAAAIYLGVVPVTGTDDAPVLGGDGPAIDHAVHMRRFPDDALLDTMARDGTLDARIVDRLAVVIADFHRGLPPTPPDAPWGTPRTVHRWATENLEAVLACDLAPEIRSRVRMLADWASEEFDRRSHQFAKRRHDGFVRECHGDLHLRNVALIEGEPVPFDCIEFNPGLRWIDTTNELAFTFMDLVDHGLAPLAWRFLSGVFERSGDYAGLATLRYYAVYRAMVRGKVALIRAGEADLADDERKRAHTSFERHLALAERLAARVPPRVVLMHGLSGSGKSTVARTLAERLGAVRVRSDVERKRLHGLDALSASKSTRDAGVYATEENRRTYERLAACTGHAIDAGWPIVVDAASLRAADRAILREAAASAGASFAIVDCRAPVEVLRERIRRRSAAADDPSEATLEVLEHQITDGEPFKPDESALAWTIDTSADPATVESRAIRLAAQLAAGATPADTGPP